MVNYAMCLDFKRNQWIAFAVTAPLGSLTLNGGIVQGDSTAALRWWIIDKLGFTSCLQDLACIRDTGQWWRLLTFRREREKERKSIPLMGSLHINTHGNWVCLGVLPMVSGYWQALCTCPPTSLELQTLRSSAPCDHENVIPQSYLVHHLKRFPFR